MNMSTPGKFTVNDKAAKDSLKCNGTGTHDEVVMESLGVIDDDCPNYIEEDDVSNSIAEGYS